MMKNTSMVLLFLLLGFNLIGQTPTKDNDGTISYITSQNIYVKFQSTSQILIGDTLYFNQNGILSPALIVTNLSSISCVCSPLSNIELKVNDKLTTKIKKAEIEVEPNDKGEEQAIIVPVKQETNPVSKEPFKPKQNIRGRLSLASYSNFSNTEGGNSQRMRYVLSLNADHISNSKISAETYIAFSHKDDNWSEIQNDIFEGLKIYNLAVKYQVNESLDLYFGRKINSNISNIGAIDGLQAEKRFKHFFTGAFVGSRPDYTDYGFNLDLFQAGAYAGHVYTNKSKREMKSTFAIVEQKNNWKTDRRFAYFQHYNSLAKNLYFFGTAELELFQNINGVQQSSLNLTNLYLMLRYRMFRNLSLTVSYSARQNLIYYETYKDFVERLIDEATLQGYKFQINYRPFKYMSLGVKAGFRSRKDDPVPTKNLNAYMSYSRVPWIKASATLSATLLETAYVSGGVYSLHLNRDIIPRKVFAGFGYRYVDYINQLTKLPFNQHVGDINITWKIWKKISLSVAYEGVFEGADNYNRVYVRLNTRF